jgi:hypothetical protein
MIFRPLQLIGPSPEVHMNTGHAMHATVEHVRFFHQELVEEFELDPLTA